MRITGAMAFGFLSVTCVACTTVVEDDSGAAESELRARICRAPRRTLQVGTQTISSHDAALAAFEPVPDCVSRSADTAVYRFHVPEPGSVKMAPIDTLGHGWTLQAFRGVQCQPGRVGQSVRCDPRSLSSYTTPYEKFGNEQYVKPSDDLIVGVAGIGGAELVDHEMVLTFEPSCGNGIPEDRMVGASAWEECEDGGRVNGDGCSSTCVVENACVLDIPRIVGEATAVVDVPSTCRTARLKGNLPWQKTVVARINATNDASVIASVLKMGGNTKYRSPRPTNNDDPWVTVAVGPKMPDTTNWICGLAPEERCAEQACRSENFVCRVRYENPGSQAYVRISNATVRGSVAVDVRIDRNLASVYAYP